MRVTSSGIHVRSLALGQHSPEETSQLGRAVGDTVSDFTGQGIEPQTDSNVHNTELIGQLLCDVFFCLYLPTFCFSCGYGSFLLRSLWRLAQCFLKLGEFTRFLQMFLSKLW